MNCRCGRRNGSWKKGCVYTLFIKLGVCLAVLFSAVFPTAAVAWDPVSGITEAIRDVTLSSEVGGQVAVIHVKEGARVKKGQKLLELDNRLEQLEVRRQKLIRESRVELDSAVERLGILKTLLDSNRALYEKTRSVSEEELLKMELEYKLAAAEIQRLEDAERREMIEYEMALETLEKRVLRSPVDGMVIKIYPEEGEHSDPREPLVRVVDTRRCRFVCNVGESVGRSLQQNRNVTLQIGSADALARKSGHIVFVSPVVDPASGLMEVTVEFDNGDGAVKPGISGNMLLNGE